MELEQQNNAQHFLDLIQKSRKGKFKIYIGMSAGVKTFECCKKAHTLLKIVLM
jgi:two-component system sensor histidine kinase KdpD